jgi:sulfur carrier protein ThiS
MKGFFIWVSIPVNIRVQLPRSQKKKLMPISDETTVLKILQKLDIKPDTCLTLIDNIPVPIDTIVKDHQTLTLIEVTSGG